MTASPVLFVSYSGLLGGAERILLDCATRLGRPAAVAGPAGPLADAAQAAGVAVDRVAARPVRLRAGPMTAARHAAGLAGFARDVHAVTTARNPCVLVAWSQRAILATALLPRHPAPVVAVHNDFVPPGAVGAAVRRATERADAVVALSEAIADALGPATILNPGVDLTAWAPSPPPPGPPRALVLGALVPWKAPHLALEVAARMPELHLDLAGAPMPGDDPAYVRHLRRRAAEPDLADRVRLLGPVDDPRPLLRDAHVLLHCGEEPWGLALVEALATGTPVVAPDAGGARDIVRDWAGRRYPPGDAAAAAGAVRAVLADPGAPAAARRRAEALDVAASAARFAAVVDDLAARGGVTRRRLRGRA